jgi:uncharacterized membrane protein HdeD (DUF308 family)
MFAEGVKMTATAPPPTSSSLIWIAVMALGTIHVFMGAAALFWPGATLTVLVFIVGIEFLISGVLRMLIAAADTAMDARVLKALLGLVSVIVGLLVMREPLRSLAVVVALLGIFWVLWGLVMLFVSLLPVARGQRGPLATEGGVAAVGGAVLLSWPEITVGALTSLVGGLLLIVGGATVWSAWRARRNDPSAVDAAGAV